MILYILLGCIAIGVLLLSEPGIKLLSIIAVSSVAMLIIGFIGLMLILVVVFFTSGTGKPIAEFLYYTFGITMLGWTISSYTIKNWKNRKKIFLEVKGEFLKFPKLSAILLLAFIFIAIVFTYSLIIE